MYLVTYLGDLCNGLTLLIISKTQISSLDLWKLFLLFVYLVDCSPFLSPVGVIALFSLPLFYRRRQVMSFL